MRRSHLTGLILATLYGAGSLAAAVAQPSSDAPAVLELYTSQGCSSCPPADKLLQQYARRQDIVALSFNVDYWDYLGWKDTLGRADHSKRQRTYARARGDGEVYTPQIVVNGRAHAVGSISRQINSAIATTTKGRRHATVPLKVDLRNGRLRVEVGADEATTVAESATIWLAAVRRKVTVPVRHGENRGRELTYYNVVLRLTPIGMWSGKKTIIELKDEDVLQGKADTCAVLVQSGKGGPIVAARWMAR